MTEQSQRGIQQADTDKQYLPVWGPWQTTGLGFAIFLINTAAQAGVLIALAAREYTINPNLGILTVVTNLATNGFLISMAVIVSGTVGVVMVIVFVKARRRASIREYLALNLLTKRQVLIDLAVVAGLIALLELVSSVTGQSPDTGFTLQVYKTADPLVLLWIAFIIFGPAFEEVFFRGFLFAGWLRSRLGPVGTIAFTSALWAVLHIQYNVYGMVQILIIGIALGITRFKTGSLWSPLLMHFVLNLTATVMLALNLGSSGG
ncbi:lysostaphin resistance A-like protein [Chloroflexota bacterium]